jgi:TPP-dependent pyruvate/acetoin dehydrogenase alpha subunit
MNVVDLEHRLIGCFGIVGGSVSAATGAALALKERDGVAVAFFGDGATNQGYFHECLNFAKVLRLPVVYVCENNLYGEFTPWEEVTAGSIAGRAQAYGFEANSIDGNDLWAVRAAAQDAVTRAREGDGPQFIEARTYRFVGHSRSDPGNYRKPGELDAWRERDPLKLTRSRLSESTEETSIAELESEIERQIAQITDNALAAPFPVPAPAREFKE